MNNFFVSQQEIAEHFKVNRTTIRAWTKVGLPYLEADRGKPAGYHIGHTLWWGLGRERFKAMEYSGATALETIMFARLDLNEKTGEEADMKSKFNEGLEVYGFSPEEIAAARHAMKGFRRAWKHAIAIRTQGRDSAREATPLPEVSA
ncbi:TPA: hypothetical protein N3A08_003511 [Salmonella enterica subsp. salamae serovar 9,46:z4,z24:z39:z42]|nr:hypothetical protein [Salmonella enterica subsp. salamae serovar 9,46:z4,z24:z39:z42]